ncbi:hypothetical protein CHLRE_02g075400v5 [Chlamydomonas reinhardtii]|uniref:Uncharacterized protein n=1 Tax=Chlamydomonas reinhardtii TaxID=3055 RepID=A0A2K3E051_CHLRE|nr:uncharacterized protein CHLRE_02g075400v5 [Chlamydomonas reinhardtii]PNW86166.1 hypothetical protein CHLRE_02g075400v5 [Chlamydomonas reinhardtii]
MSADWKNPCWNVIAEPGGLAICVTSWCVPCFTYGMNLRHLGDAPEGANVFCAGDMSKACCLYCCATMVGCGCAVHIPARQYIRKKYNISEPTHGILEDVFLTWCCPCCTVTQEYNEIMSRNGGAGGKPAVVGKAGNALADDAKKAANTAVVGAKQAVDNAAGSAEKKEEKDEKKEEPKEEKKEAEAEAKTEKKDEAVAEVNKEKKEEAVAGEKKDEAKAE